MASSTLIIKSSNWPSNKQYTGEIKLTYTAENGTITITEIQGRVSWPEDSWNGSYDKITITIGGTSKTVTLSSTNASGATGCVYFGHNNTWRTWGFTDTSWSGFTGDSASFSFTVPGTSSGTTVSGAKFSKDIPITWTTSKISYNSNGGSGAPSSQTKTHGKAITLKTGKPSRDGYTFVKWNTKSDGSGTSYQPGDTRTVEGDVTLYAQWRINVLTIKYYSNYATSCQISGSSTSVSGNQLIYTTSWNYSTSTGSDLLLDYTTSGNKIYLTRTGYSGTGYWYNSSGRVWQASTGYSVRGLADAFGVNLRTGDRTISIYAEWSAKSSTITFNANGGVLLSTSLDTYYGDTSASSLYSGYMPLREGYTFKGYYTASSGGTRIYNSDGECTNEGNYFSNKKWVRTSGVTLYAQWTQDTSTSYVVFSKDGSVTSDGFIEDSSLMITSTGYIHYPEFRESGSSIVLTPSYFQCGELIEK